MNLKKLSLATSLALFTLWSCQTENDLEEVTPETSNSTSSIQTRKLMGSEVPVLKQNDGTYMVGGADSDIVVFEENFDGDTQQNLTPMIPGRSAITLGSSGQVRKWPNNTVVYRIENLTSSMKDRFNQAMQEWESKTAVRFKERTTESNYVTVTGTGNDCNCGVATLGVYYNQGFLKFGSNASLDVIIHEIGHTLGFVHEQNREDRDQYVNVLFNNIRSGAADQFYVANNSTPLTDRLDLNSIMMYGSYTFSKDGRSPTIVDKNGNTYRKNAPGLSQGDVDGTNKVYPPAEKEDTTTTDNTTTNNDTTTKDDSNNSCSGVSEFDRNTFYRVGDKVTYQGYLFERDFSSWNLLGECTVEESKDICEGYAEFNSSQIYNVGDKVIYQGKLYQREISYWNLVGECTAQESKDICDGYSPYNRYQIYNIGDKVIYNGNLYRRVVDNWIFEGACGQ